MTALSERAVHCYRQRFCFVPRTAWIHQPSAMPRVRKNPEKWAKAEVSDREMLSHIAVNRGLIPFPNPGGDSRWNEAAVNVIADTVPVNHT